jgi:ADP-ribosylglycohydrolase
MNRKLNFEEYRCRVMGCWLGKAIGGTLGMPYEGSPGPFDLTFYDPIPERAMPNDDLDLQVLWLKMVERFGPYINSHRLARGWLDHYDFPCDEYATTLANFDRGILPPASGHISNYCGDCMGSPIRSEIWAALAPGDPELACRLALEDAVIDHDGEGIFGELFLAALESSAYVLSSSSRLIEIGLSVIPEDSRVARSVRKTVEWYQAIQDWRLVRDHILHEFGQDNWTDAPLNLAFVILGWLAGNNFGERICTAVNCGYDTDCTGATLGALLGILNPDAIPDKWKKPISRELVVSPEIKNIACPKTIDDLTDLTVRLAEQMLQVRSNVICLSADAEPAENLHVIPALKHLSVPDFDSILLTDKGLRVSIRYPQGMTFIPGHSISFILHIENSFDVPVSTDMELMLPPGWQSKSETRKRINLTSGQVDSFNFEVTAPDDMNTYSEYILLCLGQQGLRAEYRLPLLRAWQWTFKTDSQTQIGWQPEQVLYPINDLNIKSDQQFEASACFHFPRLSEPVRFILASNGAGRLTLDGREVIDYAQAKFLPLFHRMAERTFCDVILKAGWHHVEITLKLDDINPRAVLLMCRTHDLRPITDIVVNAEDTDILLHGN